MGTSTLKPVNWAPGELDESKPDESKPDESRYPSRASRTKVTLRLQRQLLKKVELLCTANGVYLQTVVEQALELLLAARRYPEWTPSRPHDDHDDGDSNINLTSSSSEPSTAAGAGRLDGQSKREGELLAYYSEHTGNRLKKGDHDALREVAHLSDNTIKAGILASIFRCKTKVCSFKYCLGAIREEAQITPDPNRVAFILSAIRKWKPGAQPNLPSLGAEVTEIGGKR